MALCCIALPNVQVSDTTKAEESTIAGKIKIFTNKN